MLKKNRLIQIVFLSVIALVLLAASYFVFNGGTQSSQTTQTVQMSATEQRLCNVLSRIDGVGEIISYVNENEEGEITGVVLIFEGANSLSVRLDVLKAAACALGIDQNSISVYAMKK